MHRLIMKNENGLTLLELLVTVAIFSVVMAIVCGLYNAQVRHVSREYRLAESEMELGIAKSVLERDIMMAGYGMADAYATLPASPRIISATDAASASVYDTLILRGTAIGILSRSSQGWSYISDNGPPIVFRTWSDGRENISAGDSVVYMDHATREIVTEGATAVFKFPSAPSSGFRGTLVYGLNSESSAMPYYAVHYVMGGTPPSICAAGTRNLLRAESRNADPPHSSAREPILNCVRDFQIAFGLDTSLIEDNVIDLWDNGGVQASAYDNRTLKRRLKQVRVYILQQAGSRDPDYLYSNPVNISDPATIRVGDSAIGTGRDIRLTEEQRRYRWKLISLSITPRNLR